MTEDEFLKCDHSNKSYRVVLSSDAVYYAIQIGDSKLLTCGRILKGGRSNKAQSHVCCATFFLYRLPHCTKWCKHQTSKQKQCISELKILFSLFYQLFWTQACPEGMGTNGTHSSHARCHPYPIPQPVKVGHTTGVYDPYSFRTVVQVLLRPT